MTNLPLCVGFCVQRLPSALPLVACSSTAALRANSTRDASGETLTEAIERHQEEATEEAAKFRRLSHADKKLLLQFLVISIARPKKLGHK